MAKLIIPEFELIQFQAEDVISTSCVYGSAHFLAEIFNGSGWDGYKYNVIDSTNDIYSFASDNDNPTSYKNSKFADIAGVTSNTWYHSAPNGSGGTTWVKCEDYYEHNNAGLGQ